MKKILIFSFVLLIVLASASAAKLPLVSIANHPELDGKQQVAGKNVLTNVDINKQPYSVIHSPSLIVSYKSSKETCPPPIDNLESVGIQTCPPINIFSVTDTTTVHIIPVQRSPVIIASQPSSSAESPTGAVVYEEGNNNDRTGIAVTVILILCITSMILITRGAASNKTRIVFVLVVMFIIAFTAMKIPKSGPTGYAVQEYEEPAAPQALVGSGCVIVNIPGQQPDTICPPNECSDGIDTTEDGFDFEDTLIDCDDPGCHDDGNANNPDSCDPDDDFEQDMDEYDHNPVVNNRIDIYDIVKWIQYFNIRALPSVDFSSIPLVDCDDEFCTGSGANCVGDEDPSGDSALTIADITFLQTTELNNDDSRTVPGGNPICFNPLP